MSVIVDITIYRGSTKLKEASDKPVRKTPGGTAGVVYGGAVYPLRTNNIINLDDDTFSKADCTEFYEDHEEIEYHQARELSIKWSTEFNNRAKYVVFDGTEQTANNLFEFLQEKGIANRLGESFRPASDGYHYDWFIRLVADCNEERAKRLVSEFAFPTDEDDIADAREIEAAMNAARVLMLSDQVTTLENELKYSKQSIEQLNSEVTELRLSEERKSKELNAACVSRDSYKKQSEEAKLKIRKYLTRRTSIQSKTPAEATDLEKKVKENAEFLETLAAENEQLADENRKLASQLENLQQSEKKLGLELQKKETDLKIERERREAARETSVIRATEMSTNKQSKTLRNFIYQVLETFIPRIQLQDDDFQCLTQEIQNPAGSLKVLKSLNNNTETPKTKKVKGYDGLFEVEDINVGNPGKAGMGRIYYKNQNGNLDVGVHIKKDDREQSRFLSNRFG